MREAPHIFFLADFDGTLMQIVGHPDDSVLSYSVRRKLEALAGLIEQNKSHQRKNMYYFAYTSNLSKKQMQSRCPDSRPMFTAVLPNYKLVFTGWSRNWKCGVATIKSMRREKVRGAVYDVTDACLRQLDKYEAGYARLNVTVFDEDNQAVSAVTHVKSGQLEETMPSKEYGEIIRQGYRDWHLI